MRTREESGRVQNTDISRAKIMEKMSESFRPTTLLADNGNLKDKFYKYNKDVIAQLP